MATNYSNLSLDNGILGRTLADRELSSKIKYCAPGTYLATGNNDCQNCGAGYYCTGGSNRTACGVGTSSASTNATSASTCVTCAAGTYNTSTGQSSCSNCGAGYYCTGGSNRTECTYGVVGCYGQNHTSDDVPPKFEFTLTGMEAADQFSFQLSAQGGFTIDWGDGSAADIVTRTNTTLTAYSHTYATAGDYTVTLRGLANGYSSNQYTAAISFQNSANKTKMTAINGDLGAMFPILNTSATGSPRFYHTFRDCPGLTSIPENLFAGLQGPPVSYMFKYTFTGCSGLTSIPAGLFSGISGAPADSMFSGTFNGCSGLTSIPAGLFSGISGAPADSMFNDTFANCTGLTGSIPAGLFGNISGAPAGYMFYGTFYGCGGLTGPSATSNGQYLYDLFPTATSSHVGRCYYGATGLSDYASIPAAWK